MGYSPWGCKESDMTYHTCTHDSLLLVPFLYYKGTKLPSVMSAMYSCFNKEVSHLNFKQKNEINVELMRIYYFPE